MLNGPPKLRIRRCRPHLLHTLKIDSSMSRPVTPEDEAAINFAAQEIQKIVRGKQHRQLAKEQHGENLSKLEDEVIEDLLERAEVNDSVANNSDDDDDLELPEWIKFYSPRTKDWYFYNQHSGVKRDKENKPAFYKKSWTLPNSKMVKRLAATFQIQLSFRSFSARRLVRLQRGRVGYSLLGNDLLIGNTVWIALSYSTSVSTEKTPRTIDYYYNTITEEIRWVKPASVLYYESVSPLEDETKDLQSRSNAASSVNLYERHAGALEAIHSFVSATNSAVGKVKIMAKRHGTVVNDKLNDREEFSTSVELLARALVKAKENQASMDTVLKEAQGDLLESFSSELEAFETEEKRTEDTQYWGDAMKLTVHGMLEIMTRANNAVMDWWNETTDNIPGDVLAYLHPELIPSTGTSLATIDRENSIPIHPTVDELGKRMVLLGELFAKARAEGFDTKEKLNEARELSQMRENEAELRVLLFRKRMSEIKREKELKFYAECRACWNKGLTQRSAAAKQKEGWTPKRSVSEIQRQVKNKIHGTHPDPWSSLEGGVKLKTQFVKLVEEERERRRHQEQTDFHVDDPEHVTGRRLLHCACFWGRDEPVKALIDMGADANKSDGVLTKFTPLHEAARSGQARISVLLLEAGAVPSLYSRTIHGETPIHIAARKGYWLFLDTVFNWLKQNGMSDTLREIVIQKSAKRKTPREVANDDSVRELMYDTEMELGLLVENKRRNNFLASLGGSGRGRVQPSKKKKKKFSELIQGR